MSAATSDRSDIHPSLGGKLAQIGQGSLGHLSDPARPAFTVRVAFPKLMGEQMALDVDAGILIAAIPLGLMTAGILITPQSTDVYKSGQTTFGVGFLMALGIIAWAVTH